MGHGSRHTTREQLALSGSRPRTRLDVARLEHLATALSSLVELHATHPL